MFRKKPQQPQFDIEWVIVGLGNPGPEYARTRHNVGFDAIEEFASKHNIKLDRGKHKARIGTGQIDGVGVALVKPMTYMNNSGIAAAKLRNFYKVPVENIFVIYDELDLTLGKVKIKQAGGDGGHNGIKSLDAHIGKNFWRIRFGIDHPGHKDMVTSYVLSDFTNGERKEADARLESIAKNVELLIKGDRELFLTKFYEESK